MIVFSSLYRLSLPLEYNSTMARRGVRDEHGVLQRQLATLLEIDTPMFSKIERGNRRAKRTLVTQLVEYFKIDKNELLTLWLTDKVLDTVLENTWLSKSHNKKQDSFYFIIIQLKRRIRFVLQRYE